jgi:hypothetical protein
MFIWLSSSLDGGGSTIHVTRNREYFNVHYPRIDTVVNQQPMVEVQPSGYNAAMSKDLVDLVDAATRLGMTVCFCDNA